MPKQEIRERSVRRKLNAIKSEFKDKNVLLVEDSIVRGTTTREIVHQVRQAGAKKVTLLVASPPVRFPNVFGIDMPSREELIASSRTVEEIQEFIGADSLIYQTQGDLIDSAKSTSKGVQDFECSIFDGDYRSRDVDEDYLEQLSLNRSDENKRRKNQELAGLDNLVELRFN